MDESELRQIIGCKKQGDDCHMPDDPKLKNYVQDFWLVRIPHVHSDAVSHVQVMLSDIKGFGMVTPQEAS